MPWRWKPEIADAIRDHYKPLGASDSAPDSELAAIIAVADKLDSIISLFAAGEKPTGSKDPLALRRAALGILRILHKTLWYTLDLATLISNQKVASDVIEFFADRLKNFLRDEGIRHDVIDAALNLSKSSFVPVLIWRDAQSLAEWLGTEDGKTALAAIKRALNILAAEEKKSKHTYSYATDKTSALTHPSEHALLKLLQDAMPATPQQLEPFTAPINAFFEAVLVNEPEFRDARLVLLAGVREASLHIADFSKIEG
jgi:glycyl-tRNA synthetase beta chain